MVSPRPSTSPAGSPASHSSRSIGGSRPRPTTSSRTTGGIGATASSPAVASSSTACSRWHPPDVLSRCVLTCFLVMRRKQSIVGVTNVRFIFVGYAGFYGLSLIVGSYALLFVSMAAHAAQFAFLAFFENPRTSTLNPSARLPFSLSTLPFQTSNGSMANASSSLNASPSRSPRTCLQRAEPGIPQPFFSPPPSPALASPRKRRSSPTSRTRV
jgi:hypothetical protein